MNHLASRMIGGINSSMQNRIALVDERFISKALSSFVAGADHPDCPSDCSAERLQTQILPAIVPRAIQRLLIWPKNFCETASLLADWLFGGQNAATSSVFLWHERLC